MVAGFASLPLQPFLLLGPLLLLFLYRKLRWYRIEQFKEFPRLEPSLIWGHLRVMGDAMKAIGILGTHKHVDYVLEYMWRQAGCPSVLMSDARPLSYPLVVVFSHTVAEQISRPSSLFRYSVTKSPTVGENNDIWGSQSIISAEGERWKALRKRFNPGFQPAHLMSLLPRVVQKTRLFINHLEALVASGEVANLDRLCTNLTFDIIGTVVLDVDFHAQDPPNDGTQLDPDTSGGVDVLKTFTGVLGFYESESNPFQELNPIRRLLRYRAGKRNNAAVQEVIRRQFQKLKVAQADGSNAPVSQKGKSVLALSLQGVDTLTPDILSETADQIRSFLFAGHDTTSILLQWALYMLSIHPSALATLTAELDSVLGPETLPQGGTLTTILEKGEAVLSKLTYLSAVIKETLRLFPPAGSARMALPGSGFFLKLDEGPEVCVDGCILYIMHYGIQRHENTYGPDAKEWKPERWLGNVDTSMETNTDGLDANSNSKERNGKIDATAWRPFERGPRNCIGQELANLEARVILASVARRYQFEKIGIGEYKDGKLVGEELLNRRRVTAKPIDGMKMRIHYSADIKKQEELQEIVTDTATETKPISQ